MGDAIIAAIITGSISLIGIILSNYFAGAKRKAEQADFVRELYAKLDKQSELSDARLDAKIEKLQAVTDTKLEELTREVRAHNNFAQRVPVTEEQIKALEKRVMEIEHRT